MSLTHDMMYNKYDCLFFCELGKLFNIAIMRQSQLVVTVLAYLYDYLQLLCTGIATWKCTKSTLDSINLNKALSEVPCHLGFL